VKAPYSLGLSSCVLPIFGFGNLLFHAAVFLVWGSPLPCCGFPYVVLLMYRQILHGVELINIDIQRRLRPESF
jgi:hypothetical protein